MSLVKLVISGWLSTLGHMYYTLGKKKKKKKKGCLVVFHPYP